MRLLPREEKFYTFFLRQVALISEAATTLLAAAKAGNAHLAQAAVRIKQLEEQGDEVIHDILTRLNQTFITPLDPEDLHSLSTHLDDVLDGLEDAAHRIVAYHLDPVPPVAISVCERIVACTRELELAITALSSNKNMLTHCIEINRIEEEVDELVRGAIKELFENERDAIKVMKLKEVYELLEQTTDYCEDVAGALQNVLVKNS
jgi:predicted phosphate transport protein (TIGR00153 family)